MNQTPYYWQYLSLLMQVAAAFLLGLVMVTASWFVGQATVVYQSVGGGLRGHFAVTAPVPLRDPAWTAEPVPVYQPLMRAQAVSTGAVIYVLGGVSRVNTDAGDKFFPTGSVAHPENRVWFCHPNPGGTINPEGLPGGWATTTALPAKSVTE